MNSLKRIFVSIKGQIDQVADEFENHEALAGAAIQDLQIIGRKTRLNLHRVSQLTAQHKKHLSESKEQSRLWSERAIMIREEDEEKALQCVKRWQQAQQTIGLIEQQCQESIAEEMKVRADLDIIQAQLQSLKNKKEILVARQNRASVHSALGDQQGNSYQDVQNVFERWEDSVVSSEFVAPEIQVDVDHLAQEFEQEEETLTLKIMLDELTEHSQTADKKH